MMISPKKWIHQRGSEEMTDEQRKIDRLYEILDKLEKQKDTENSAALRWAIFQLEQLRF